MWDRFGVKHVRGLVAQQPHWALASHSQPSAAYSRCPFWLRLVTGRDAFSSLCSSTDLDWTTFHHHTK